MWCAQCKYLAEYWYVFGGWGGGEVSNENDYLSSRSLSFFLLYKSHWPSF